MLTRRRSPLLGEGGVAAPSSKWSRSFGGAAGVVRSTSDNRWLEPTILPCFALSGSHSLRSCPSAPAKEASRHFLNGRIHPSFCQGVPPAVLLASSMTARKSAGRKQRSYPPTSLRGEYALPVRYSRFVRSPC